MLRTYLTDKIGNSAYMLDPNSDSDLILFPGLFIFILRFHEKLCEWYAAKRNIKDYCCTHNFKIFNISVYLSENQQDKSNTPQMEMDSKTSSENIDNIQVEGPRDQTVSPEETIYVILDVNIKPNKRRKHRPRVMGELVGDPQHSEVVRKAVGTRPGRERLVYSAEGTDTFLNLGMPLRCSPENRHVRVTFSPKRSETGKEEQVFGRFNNTSADCVKFYIHTVGKTRKTLLK